MIAEWYLEFSKSEYLIVELYSVCHILDTTLQVTTTVPVTTAAITTGNFTQHWTGNKS